MSDIMHGEHLKKILRMLLKTGYKFLKKDMAMVNSDLRYTQNPVIKNLNTLVIIGANNLHQKDNWQKNMVLGYGQSLLWVVTKDTAYRDVFFWTLDKLVDSIIKNPKKWKQMLKPYIKSPEEWTPNLWSDSKLKSDKLKREGKIPKNAKSLEEVMFTPSAMKQKLKKRLQEK
jgi:hypothetical protein